MRRTWGHRSLAMGAALLLAVSAACGGGGSPSPDAAAPAKVSITHLVIDTSTTTSPAAGSPAAGSPTSAGPGAVAQVAPTTPPATAALGSAGRPWRIMALGDSLTQGDDAANPSTPQSYRGALYSSLVAAGHHVDMVGSDRTVPFGGGDADNEGHGGYTIGPDASTLCSGCEPANLSAHVASWIPQADPDVILLLAGVNDLFPEPTPKNGVVRPVDPADAPAKLAGLVQQLQALQPEAQLFVASYPPLPLFAERTDASGIAFDDLNGAARTIGSGGGNVHYVPLAEELALQWAEGDTLADGVHPTASGAAKIAAVFESVLTEQLGQPAAG